jgi:hypothetical protein
VSVRAGRNSFLELKRCSAWAKLAEDSYVVETDETAEAVSDRFDRHLSRADTLLLSVPHQFGVYCNVT